MDLSGDMPVTLVIKAPNQRMEDQTVDCMLGWTIKKLKQHLETVYPSKPKHNEQRLIYSGRLLQDHLTLKEILRQFESETPNKHTVHLVCSKGQDYMPSTTSSAPKTPTPPASSSQASTASMGDGEAGSTTGSSQSDGIRYRGQGQPATSTSIPSVSGQYPPYSMYQPGFADGGTVPGHMGGTYTPEQYAWMMQQQQQYMMMQYMQYYQSLYYPGQSFNNQLPPSPFTPMPQVHGAPLPQQPQPAQPDAAAAAANNAAAPRAAGGRQNVRMNAQGGMEEDDDDEDGEPRDWLHHTYFFMRFLTFMGILFFYSTMSRFLIVFSGSVAIYILQKIRKYVQRVQREQEAQQQRNDPQQEPQQQQQEPPPEQQQQQEDGQIQDRGNTQEDAAVREEDNSQGTTGSTTNTTDGSEQPVQAEEQHGRVAQAFVFFCNTVQTFFTSLLPTPPELLEPN